MSANRCIVVTGASRGIGRAIALAFAQAGREVWALARSPEALAALAAEPQAQGRIRPLAFDAATPDGVDRALEALAPRPAPWALVNNAGIAHSAPLHQTTPEAYAQVMAVNVTAPFMLCRGLMPRMVEAGGGAVINIASTAGLKGYRYTSAYCASKHALVGLTRALAVEYGAKGVTVNAVCPGWTDTDLLAESARNIAARTQRSQEQAKEVLAKMNPQQRLIQPQDVAALCAFLASEAATSITGAVYPIDGGESAG